MNQNIGNLERKGISIFVMQQVKYTQFLRIWQLTSLYIGEPFCAASFYSGVSLMCTIEFLHFIQHESVIHNFSLSRHILHRYANEDVSLGSWFIGLDVEHIDERSLCCGTPPGKCLNI